MIPKEHHKNFYKKYYNKYYEDMEELYNSKISEYEDIETEFKNRGITFSYIVEKEVTNISKDELKKNELMYESYISSVKLLSVLIDIDYDIYVKNYGRDDDRTKNMKSIRDRLNKIVYSGSFYETANKILPIIKEKLNSL